MPRPAHGSPAAGGTSASTDADHRPSIVIHAPAKINLTLQIIARRPDGYHELCSWVALIDLCDELTIAPADDGGIRFTCDHVELPTDRRNLVVRAVEAVARAARRPANVAIHLAKRVPFGGGLGGGSSDAAATIAALDALWGLGWSREQMMQLGATIGSDVPLFFCGAQSVIRGRGERVEPVAAPWRGAVVLVLPNFGVATPAVYKALQPVDRGRPRPDVRELLGLPAHELAPRLFNDLQPAAFRVEPRLDALWTRLSRLGDAPVHMSGSGTALFTIFDDRGRADEWRRAVERQESATARAVTCDTWQDSPGSGEGDGRDGHH